LVGMMVAGMKCRNDQIMEIPMGAPHITVLETRSRFG